MAIEFACPKCSKRFRVKSELAGKIAKCQCGSKLRIPAPKSAGPPAGSSPKSADDPSTYAWPPTAPQTKPAKAAKAPPLAAKDRATDSKQNTASWLDDELELAPPAKPPPRATCPKCNVPMNEGAVVCVACGFDSRTGTKHTVHRDIDDDPGPGSKRTKKKSKAGFAFSLARGTLFSFIAALLGAGIWAVIALLTHREFGLLAWALGGLCGLGMALGHEDDDGTMAGIIAAFMAIFAIVASKIFIAILFVVILFSKFAGMADQAFVDPDSPEGRRQLLTLYVATENMEHLDEDADWSTIDEINAQAQQEVAAMTDEEVEQHLAVIEQDIGGDPVDDTGAEGDEMAMDPLGADDEFVDDEFMDDEFVAVEDDGMGFWQAFGGMFGVFDGIWMLFAFFTAYKVGSGKATD